MKARILSASSNGMPDHELLELLLFYSISRRNTNELAHALINRFGSLAAVIDADSNDLQSVDGIGEHTASLIKLLPQIIGRYSEQKSAAKSIVFDTVDKMGSYLVSKFLTCTCESVYLLLLDKKNTLIECTEIYRGSVNSCPIYISKIARKVFTKQTCSVIVAHNHLNGICVPSRDDIMATIALKNFFDAVDVNFIEHIIVSGNDFRPILREAFPSMYSSIKCAEDIDSISDFSDFSDINYINNIGDID